jgi:hypothetical protein
MTAVYIVLNLFWQWLEKRPDEKIKQESSPTGPVWAASRVGKRRRLQHRPLSEWPYLTSTLSFSKVRVPPYIGTRISSNASGTN